MTLLRIRRGITATAVVGALVAAPAVAHAQTVTTGSISGVVTDPQGERVGGVDITLIHRTTGARLTVVADIVGKYRGQALSPGQYDLRAEALGYRPLVVLDIRVGPAEVVDLDVRLTPADPPVSAVDTILYAEGAVHASVARGTWVPGSEVVDLVEPLGRASSLAQLAALATGGLAIEGLPDRLGVVGIDGMPTIAAAHPGVARTDYSALAFPFSDLDYAQIGSATDVEWRGVGGDLLSTFSARPPRNGQLRAHADVTSGSARGSLVAGGPLVRDTAWALIGIDARRLETSLPAPWTSDSIAAAVTAVAEDSFQTDLSGYARRVAARTDLVTGFGRFDWAVANGQMLSLRASLANLSASDFDLGAGRPVGLGSSLSARDIWASAAYSSRLTRGILAELKLDVDRSLRNFHAPDLPGTVVVSGDLSAGADAALPGRFERNATRFTGALSFRLGAHEFKVGLATTRTSHDITYDPWRAGSFVFASAADLEARRGVFVQSVGAVPAASFSINALGFFGQDTWVPMPGLSIEYGLRIEGERWPTGAVSASQDWLDRTGISSAFVPRLKTRLSPRFSVTWSAGPRAAWLFRGSAGSYAESVDPSTLAEVLTHSGSAEMRRGLGVLGSWPATPDSIVAPLSGTALTLFNAAFESPRSQRVALSLARQFGSGLSLEVAGRYRHTEYLPRRSDLNLAPAPEAFDQYGRPLYGSLQQEGALLAAIPGSNRRFSGFDRVWALDATGYSDFIGMTVSVERVKERGLSLWASYTYSQTKDNAPGLAGSVPDRQLSPFPSDPQQADWRDGRSDLDVPHQAAVGGEWALGRIRLIALLRYRSGLPFTPGFRDGVDANGDGAWGNDPAFIIDTVAGADALLHDWSCLQHQVGRFAARNSCRGPAVTSVDVRVVVRAFTLLGSPADVVVDGLNLVSTGSGLVDRAAYLVDETRTLAVDPTTGAVTVPLVANPGFGKLRVRRSPGAAVRFGVRLGL